MTLTWKHGAMTTSARKRGAYRMYRLLRDYPPMTLSDAIASARRLYHRDFGIDFDWASSLDWLIARGQIGPVDDSVHRSLACWRALSRDEYES